MRDILEKNYHDLGREISNIFSLINEKSVPDELLPFKNWFINYLREIKEDLDECLYYLITNQESIFPEILNILQTITLKVRKLGVDHFPSIFRHEAIDLFCLRFLKWLHDQHEQSKDIAFGISDGHFAIYPTQRYPIIYFLPLSARKNLIYFPLFFHEFGHYLYSAHFAELRELATSLQNKIKKFLVIPNQHNNKRFEKKKRKNLIIAEVWFEWIQEIFCDAVGLHIGGVSFLKSFSLYFRMMGRDEFYLTEEDLGKASHPCSWLRIKLLIQRAKIYGLVEEADQLDYEWNEIAKYLNVKEDYYGFYDKRYNSAIVETIDEMLNVTKPIKFSQLNIDSDSFDPVKDNFIKLVNLSWSKYENDIDNYMDWENDILKELLM